MKTYRIEYLYSRRENNFLLIRIDLDKTSNLIFSKIILFSNEKNFPIFLFLKQILIKKRRIRKNLCIE